MVESEADWNLYRTFLAVVRAGSLSAASRRLGSTQPTVGRQIEALEAVLGTKLFTRSPHGLLPTSAARELVAHAEAMEAAASAMRRASSGEPQGEIGTVRLTTGAQIGIEMVPKMLADFSRRHPRIELELSISARPEDLLHRSADIAVRVTRPTQKALTVRRVGSAAVGLFAHRDYVEAYGVPRSIADLARYHVIGFDREMHLLQAFGGLAAGVKRENFSFRTDNVTAQLALLRAGAGIAACHVTVAKGYGGMIPILPGEVAFQRQIWLVMHADLKKTRRVRLLFEHLQRELTRHLATQ